MGKTMPKWALHKSHPKHPLHPLYASRKLIYDQLASTKSHLEKLYTNEEYLYSSVQQQIDWYRAQATRPIDHRALLIGLNENITSQPVAAFVVLRYLQKQINNVRKTVQDTEAEYLGNQIVATLERNLYIFGKLIVLELWRAYNTEEPKPTNQVLVLDFWKLVTSDADGACTEKHDILQKDRVFALIWGIECCQCFHQQEEAFLDIVFYLHHNPAERTRFEPQTLSACLSQIEIFHHLADTAHILLGQQTHGPEKGCFKMEGLELFVENFVNDGPEIFALVLPIELTVQALETYVGRRRNSQEHIDHSLMWMLILKHLKTVQKDFDMDSSEFKELIDIFHQQGSAQPTSSPAPKGKITKKTDFVTKEKETKTEIEKDREPGILFTPQSEEIAKHEDIVLDDGFNKNEDDQLRREGYIQAKEHVNETGYKDQLTNRAKTISKYHQRGYGKCEDSYNIKKHSQNTEIRDRIWQIASSEHYHWVWRVIFPQTRHDRQVSRVSWPMFVEAMTSEPVNCRVKKSDGSIFVFERRNGEGGKEIFQCHAPHDMTWIPASDLYRYKKDLRDTFGMDTNRLLLAEE